MKSTPSARASTKSDKQVQEQFNLKDTIVNRAIAIQSFKPN